MPRRSEDMLSLLNQNRIIFRRVKDKKGLIHPENFLRYFLLLNVINQLLADNEGSAGKLDRIGAQLFNGVKIILKQPFYMGDFSGRSNRNDGPCFRNIARNGQDG